MVVSNNFKINECNKCVYAKNTLSDYIIVCLYMDDILIIGSNNDIIMATKKILASYFDLKDIGKENVILEIKISKTSEELVLSQSHYIKKI